jgi:zinc transport system substrate-binding protein
MKAISRKLAILAACLALTLAALPGALAQDASDGELTIVCADTMLADLTHNVVGDLATVTAIRPAGACPAHFDVRPSDVGVVASADIIVQLGWEPWLGDLISAAGKEGVAQVKCMGLDDWNIPDGAKQFVDVITEGLSAALPEHAATFQANAASYKAAIDAKAAEVEAIALSGGLQGRRVVVMAWQQKFVEWLGCEVVGTYPSPETMSTQQAMNATNAAEGAELVVDNLQSGTDFGAEVASRSGAMHVVLTNFPGSAPGAETYLDMLEVNARALVAGGEQYDYREGEIADLETRVDALELQGTTLAVVAVVGLVAAGLMGAMLVRERRRGE